MPTLSQRIKDSIKPYTKEELRVLIADVELATSSDIAGLTWAQREVFLRLLATVNHLVEGKELKE